MLLHDGGAAVTASGFGKVAGYSKIIDLGGALNRFDQGVVGSESRLDAVVVIDISAITTATDGHYRIHVMGSNYANMASPVSLGCLELGLGTALALPGWCCRSEAVLANTYSGDPAGNTTWPGRREILFTTEQNDIITNSSPSMSRCSARPRKASRSRLSPPSFRWSELPRCA